MIINISTRSCILKKVDAGQLVRDKSIHQIKRIEFERHGRQKAHDPSLESSGAGMLSNKQLCYKINEETCATLREENGERIP